jgi:cytosine/adenosine deaminase-related metal-dependent hydrolase/ubiquinone/menaquinone biosynthesis C-methylase UbiE
MNTLSSLKDANADGFAKWAEVYDEQDNPLLNLEERFLSRMLPDTNGRHILDVGCGTGRWLERLVLSGKPECTSGLDASLEMLDVAKRRPLANTRFIHAQLPTIPVNSASVDLILASFVLSYVHDLDSCALEIARVLRDGGDVFITDMHPRTAVQLGWERRFSSANNEYVLKAQNRSVEKIINVMDVSGFRLLASYEPCFGQPERAMFYSHRMDDAWQAAQGKPAIYLLHFRKAVESLSQEDQSRLLIERAHCAVGEHEVIRANVSIYRKRIEKLVSSGIHEHGHPDARIDLDGYVLFPGLINAHDHLEFALFPRLGAPPYRNATEWALDIQGRYATTIAQHKQVPNAVRLWWGGLRNLLCGVTTVCHHNPIDPVLCDPGFPIKVLTEFGWEHSPAFAKDLASSLQQTGAAEPFIIHACEGTDSVAANDLHELMQVGAIDHRTVLVHGLALSTEDIEHLNRLGASIVTCMSSNYFLFGQTPSLEHLQLVERLALGSDSPLTSIGDLLDEVRFSKEVRGTPASMLYACVTEKPAQILRLRQGEGRIRPGSPADVFAVHASNLSPSESLTSLRWNDVELVLVDGIVRLASSKMLKLLPETVVQGLNPIVIDGVVRWLAAPTIHMFEAAANILGQNNVSLCGRTISVMEA